jgi:hypothetical protein
LLHQKQRQTNQKKMKKVYLVILVLSFIAINAKAQSVEDSLREQISEMKDRINGIDERLMTSESDLSKLTKIKFSGYIQAQFDRFENRAVQPNNYFSLRRVRLKATYEAADGIKFVVQPDFSPSGVTLKDAYVVLNDHFIKSGFFYKTFSLTMGKFNRLNYEVEYSSSQRELPERSTIIRAIYPGERAIGFKLEANPESIPLKLQLALFNGNDGGFNQFSDTTGKTSGNVIENKDFDNFKDIMARATYSFKLGSFGGLDFGTHAYFGSLKSSTNATLRGDYTTIDSSKIGDAVQRNWFGAEFQLFADVLGGMSLKGEYITGKNAMLGGNKFANGSLLPNFQNNFAGYYVYFIKNIGKKNQFAFRYDYYDPNTDITGADIKVIKYNGDATKKIGKLTSSKADLAYTTFTFAWHYYFDDNIRVSLAYAIVQNEKVALKTDGTGNLTETYTNPDGSVGTNDYSKIFNQNQLTLRLQAKF